MEGTVVIVVCFSGVVTFALYIVWRVIRPKIEE